MPAPRWLARLNRRLTNPVLGRVAPRLPGFGLVLHTGRTSQRQYRTPVNVFRRGDAYVIALTYGADAQWVRNVLANGGCALVTRGRRLELTQPRLFHDPGRRAMPRPVRVALRLLDVTDFLELWPGGRAAHPGDVTPSKGWLPSGSRGRERGLLTRTRLLPTGQAPPPLDTAHARALTQQVLDRTMRVVCQKHPGERRVRA